jgi:hypothetical protein
MSLLLAWARNLAESWYSQMGYEFVALGGNLRLIHTESTRVDRIVP